MDDLNRYLTKVLSLNGIGSQRARWMVEDATKQDISSTVLSPEISHEMKRLGVKVINCWQPKYYPSALLDLDDFPVALFVLGSELDLLRKPKLTIVGSRRSSRYGMRVTKNLLIEVSKQGVDTPVIISGLAYGIDSVAHMHALAMEIGTVAVVAGGIGGGYPARNYSLYQKICNAGLVVAEYPPGVQVVKGMFPMRNRLMAALSPSCVVVEAMEKSGTLITAGIVVGMGRELVVVPGRVDDTLSMGCNELIASGAKPMTSYRESTQDLLISQKLSEDHRIQRMGQQLIDYEPMIGLITSKYGKRLHFRVRDICEAMGYNMDVDKLTISANLTRLVHAGILIRTLDGYRLL